MGHYRPCEFQQHLYCCDFGSKPGNDNASEYRYDERAADEDAYVRRVNLLERLRDGE